MSSSDETLLEAFIESLQTVPSEVRRNLELVKDLDGVCSADLHQLRQLQKEYILAAEQKMLNNLELVEMDPDEISENDGAEAKDDERKRKANEEITTETPASAEASNNERAPVYGVRVLNADGTAAVPPPPPASSTDLDRGGRDDNTVVVLPTTLEFMAYISTHHHQAADNNNNKYKQIRQLQTDCLQKADEKVAVAQQAYEMVDAQVQRLDRDLAAMEQILQAAGEFQSGGAKPNDLAACQVTPGSEWILAKVIQYDVVTGSYKLADEDVESNKVFHLPENQVIVLSGAADRFSKGDSIFAVYPDTTSFYPATVVQAPRKPGPGQFIMVNFIDDSDEFGITHDKAVPMEHVMPPP